MNFELWASGGPAWAAVPGSSGLAWHETGPRARAWAASRARGLARHGPTLYWAGPGTARLRAGQAGFVLGPGRVARMAIYKRECLSSTIFRRSSAEPYASSISSCWHDTRGPIAYVAHVPHCNPPPPHFPSLASLLQKR